MATAAAATEINTRLATEWVLVEPNIPIYQWEETNSDIGADPDALFLIIEFVGGQGVQKSVGAPNDNWWAEIGVFNLHLYYPAGSLAQAARAALAKAAIIFRGISENAIIYRAPFPPRAGLEGSLSGNWMSLSMSVPYEYRIRA
jgi:hypothetical protein